MHQTVAYRTPVAAANEGERHAVHPELFAAAQRLW
jgi:hypothetical protein